MNVRWNHGLADGGRTRAGIAPSIAPEAQFPQLANFHNEAVALAHIRDALGHPAGAERCAVLNVWHIAGKSLRVVYRLGGTRDAPGDSILTVRFLPPGESRARYREAIAAARDTAAVFHLPAWDAVGWRFPEDPHLASLPGMLDMGRARDRLDERGDSALEPDEITWSALSYLPGERCSIRYACPRTERVIVGKLHGGATAAAAQRTMDRLWESPGRGFRMPRPLGLDEETGVRWEEFVPGQRVEELLTRVALPPLLRQVCSAIADPHALPISGLAVRGPAETLQRLECKVLPRIAAVLPALAGPSAAVFEDLTRGVAGLAQRPLGTIHGDLHTANVLVDHNGVILIDLDDLALGDPAHDLALFGGRLLLLALLRNERLGEVARAVAELPTVYESAGGTPIPAQTFAWYMAALLIGRQIKTCLRHAAPDVGHLAPTLLAYARQTVARGRFTDSIVCG